MTNSQMLFICGFVMVSQGMVNNPGKPAGLREDPFRYNLLERALCTHKKKHLSFTDGKRCFLENSDILNISRSRRDQ